MKLAQQGLILQVLCLQVLVVGIILLQVLVELNTETVVQVIITQLQENTLEDIECGFYQLIIIKEKIGK